MKTLQTVDRALEFLEIVAQSAQPPKIKDVAKALGLKITTSYHLLKTLENAGYINRDDGGFLRIGHRVTVLYQGMVRQQVLGRALHSVVEGLSAITSETAYLTVRTKDGLIVETLVEGNQAVRVKGLRVGFSGAEHIRASGLAALAFMDDADRDVILAKSLEKLSMKTRRSTIKSLAAEFEQIREQGWALDNQTFEKDVCCVAAPFFQADGKVAGSISVSAPASRFRDSGNIITAAVCAKARLASESLGNPIDIAQHA